MVRCKTAAGARRGEGAAGVPLSRFRVHGHDRPQSAVAQLGAFEIVGLPAWLLWSFTHIYFLIGFRNRLAVAMNWGLNYITFQRGTRLITGISGSRIRNVVAAVITAPPMAADAVRSGRGSTM